MDTAFHIFSVTKLYTVISVLQTIEKGLIRLDDPVGKILPEIANPQIITASPGDNPPFKLTPATRPITVRHLLTHTSGFSYDGMNPELQAWRKSRGETPLTMTGALIEAYNTPLLFEPGSNWTYGCSIDWAGLLVERLNGGIKLGEYFKRHILAPLKLSNTSFHPKQDAELAKMFARNGEGLRIQVDSPLSSKPGSEKGGIGLVATANDLVEVLRDLLQDKPTLLKPESITLLQTPKKKKNDPQFAGLIKQKVRLPF